MATGQRIAYFVLRDSSIEYFYCFSHVCIHYTFYKYISIIFHSKGTRPLDPYNTAWNVPLRIESLYPIESSLGGHNDILVTTFVLLGIFYAVRAEKKGEVHIIHYAPTLIALSLAALVKSLSFQS